MSITSFYFAIFRRLQAVCYSGGGPNDFIHVKPDSNPYLDGGFSLYSTQDMYGIYHGLGPQAMQATNPSLSPGMMPLNPNSLDPTQNPLWVMLNTSLQANPPDVVVVNGQTWPVMPPDGSTIWETFNAGNPRLIDAFGSWITNGKADDSPSFSPISLDAIHQASVPAWPIPPTDIDSPLLFVASIPNDDGRRPGDGSTPPPPAIPSNFWATSQIFLTDETGKAFSESVFVPGMEYYVVALIGNANPRIDAGEFSFNGQTASASFNPKFQVQCDAQCFSTFTSPSVPLPSLDNLDPTSSNNIYEEFYLAAGKYDAVGFRFNVDAVFSGLEAALKDPMVAPMLMGVAPDVWLRRGHVCVRVRIMMGENPNKFSHLPAPTLESNPQKDRHIAQHNLVGFPMDETGMRAIRWTNFIVGQAGPGWNELSLLHELPASFQFYVAVAREAYDRFIDPATSAGGIFGLDVVQHLPSNPFPDAVILRQTGAVRIRIAPHGEQAPLFGMSLGVEGDLASLPSSTIDRDISVVHAAHDGMIVGGFTLRIAAA